jgi:hypothetical protein
VALGVVLTVATMAGAVVWATTQPPPPGERPSSASVPAERIITLPGSGDAINMAVGRWLDTEGVLAVTEAPPLGPVPSIGGPRAAALADLDARDGFVAAQMAPSGPGWGLVFRWAGPANFGFVTAAPQFASLIVGVVIGGAVTELARFSPAPMATGTVIEVDAVGDVVTVWANGRPVGTVGGAPIMTGGGWGIAGDPRTIGVAGWSAVRAGPVVAGDENGRVSAGDVSTDDGGP